MMHKKNDFRFYYSPSGKYNDLQRIGKRSQFLYVYNYITQSFIMKIGSQSIRLTKKEAAQFFSGKGLTLVSTLQNYDPSEGVWIELKGSKKPVLIPDYWFKVLFVPQCMTIKNVLRCARAASSEASFDGTAAWMKRILGRYYKD